MIENGLAQGQSIKNVLNSVEKNLEILSDSVLRDQPPVRRKKIEILV